MIISILIYGISITASFSSYPILSNQLERDDTPRQAKIGFRYVIICDPINVTDPNDPPRRIDVLLDPKAFSEETLATLMRILSKRYPEPEWMIVHVWTNLEQVHTPGEPRMSEAPYNPILDEYHRAILIRKDGNELFRYNPNPPSTRMKTVILKGEDPYSKKE